MRDRVNEAIREATDNADRRHLHAMRLVATAIRDRDIAAGNCGRERMSDDEIAAMLAQLACQLHEAAHQHEAEGRLEAAAQSREEAGYIDDLLPKRLDGKELVKAVGIIIEELDAAGLKDMGRVMAVLRQRHGANLDATAMQLVKATLKEAAAKSES